MSTYMTQVRYIHILCPYLLTVSPWSGLQQIVFENWKGNFKLVKINFCFSQQNKGESKSSTAASSSPADLKDKKKERILDLSRYMDKLIRVKFTGGREAAGVLKGYDPLLNIVLDNTVEYLRGITSNILLQIQLLILIFSLHFPTRS